MRKDRRDKILDIDQIRFVAGNCLHKSAEFGIDNNIKAFALLLFKEISLKYNILSYKNDFINLLNNPIRIRYEGELKELAERIFKTLYS